jgi:dTDP-4-amino-4,6-dideoxygalactose transaminase
MQAPEAERQVFPADRQVVYTNYARTALEAVVRTEGLDGTDVLTAAFNCRGTFDPLFRKYDMTPVFVDVELPSMLPDRAAAESRADEADVLLLVHAFGLPAEMDFWVEFARDHDLLLVEDCARALGATYDGRLVGGFGDAAFYSLRKVTPAMKGGVAVRPDGSGDVELPPPSDDVSYYAPADYGNRDRLPPALPMRALDRLNGYIFDSFATEKFADHVRENRHKADRLRSGLAGLVEFQPHREGRAYFWLSGTVPGNRDALFEHLQARDIPVYRIWDDPWAQARSPAQFERRFPNSDYLARHALHFPVRVLGPDGIDEAVSAVRAFYRDRD